MELIDLVDNNDSVIGTTTKEKAHEEKQYHRVAAVYVFDQEGRLLVQEHVKSNGRLDHSVGGHVSKGETYHQAALREAKEELRLELPLTAISVFLPEFTVYNHFFGLFECTITSDWSFEPTEEVKKIIPMKLSEIIEQMQSTPEKFTNGFINTMKEYIKQKKLPYIL